MLQSHSMPSNIQICININQSSSIVRICCSDANTNSARFPYAEIACRATLFDYLLVTTSKNYWSLYMHFEPYLTKPSSCPNTVSLGKYSSIRSIFPILLLSLSQGVFIASSSLLKRGRMKSFFTSWNSKKRWMGQGRRQEYFLIASLFWISRRRFGITYGS